MASAAAAAPSGLSKKPHYRVPESASTAHQIPSKSHSNSLCKTLIVLVLLLFIPMFPSQAPDFISQTIFTDFWEIFHLLFIGIAVSYGLFSRKTAQTGPEKVVHSRSDDSHAYLSGISHLSSIFEDGFENICGPEEHDVMQSYGNCQCLQSRDDQFLGKDRCVVHGDRKIRSFISNDGSEKVSEISGKNVNQAWCSQYLKGESLVVVSNSKYFLGGSSDFKPLNLPVRSLRSRVVDNDKHELKRRRESSPRIEERGNNDVKVLKIRGVVPMNLEKKFEEAGGSSSIPWRSRSGKMEYGDERSNPKPPTHCRPRSVGQFEFEHLKFRSSRGSKFSSSPELTSSKVEDVGRKKVFVSHPKIAPLKAEAALFGGVETRSFNGGASSETNGLGDMEYDLKNSGDNGEEDEVGKGKRGVESLDSGIKSPTLAKVLSRAKSVRTIKPSRYVGDEKEQLSNQIDGKVGRSMHNKVEVDSLVRGEEHENPPDNHHNEEFNSIFPMPKPKPTVAEFKHEEKEDLDARNITESEGGGDTESEFDKSSDEEDDARTNVENDAELEGSEVDRKAGEFIAKFREQIRLQKISLAEGYNGW
ncbi:hypothetical protein Salat_2874500 [Sesamum alatum]|uniref:Uncharacterized protein n=1 Tax=Sesamum alatum TaxID=300844 RepID=A0AAE1XMI9_9LAMI|nr:hypothetical protein Salat_2874500 [Sesamum alatum]